MKAIPLVVCFVLLNAVSQAEVILQQISWSELQTQGLLMSGKVHASTDPTVPEYLQIERAVDTGVTIPLATIETPGITRRSYALLGKVKHEGVQGKGYLEIRNYFGDSERYFTRTLSDSGPMKSLEGSSDWREFSLPFTMEDTTKRPSKIQLNITFAGKGTVSIGPVRLVEYDEAEIPAPDTSGWWTEQQGGWLGGVIGCLGGLFGCLGGLAGSLAYRGKARGFSFGVLYVMTVLGILSLLGGLSALAVRQPYHVYFPLLLTGLLFGALGLGLIPTMRKRYEQAEERLSDEG
jgi:hypothetical protein